MDLFTRGDLQALMAEHPSPCISLFMPAHRGGSEQDPIRWRKHLTEAEDRLVKTGARAADVRELLTPARHLLDDGVFWRHQCDGLAAFIAPRFLRLFRLPLALADEVMVGNRFAIIPLLPLLNSNGRFYVLALSKHGVRLLQGTRDSVSEVDLNGVPKNLAEALLAHEAKEPFSFVGRRAGAGAGSWAGIFHGHGVGMDDPKDELLNFFQQIDRGLHPLLHEERAPLLLAAVEYLQPIYRQANTYAHLLAAGIHGNPDRLSSKELHDLAWPLVKPVFDEAQKRAIAQFQQLADSDLASSAVEKVVAAARAGRAETLFVALGRQIWGILDPDAGRIEQHEQPLPGDADLLELAAAHTLMHGRAVYAVEPGEFPGQTAMAAVFGPPLPKHGKRP